MSGSTRNEEKQQRNRRLRAIDPTALYPLPVLAEAAGLTVAHGLRTAQARGLRTYTACGRKYCLGQDFIEWVTRQR